MVIEAATNADSLAIAWGVVLTSIEHEILDMHDGKIRNAFKANRSM